MKEKETSFDLIEYLSNIEPNKYVRIAFIAGLTKEIKSEKEAEKQFKKFMKR